MAETPPPTAQDSMRELARQMRAALGHSASATTPEDQLGLKRSIETALAELRRKHTPFPPCTDVLLSTINTDVDKYESKGATAQILEHFADYFRFGGEPLLGPNDGGLIDPVLRKQKDAWPPQWCLPQPAVALAGNRHAYVTVDKSLPPMRRLLTGDLIWLFYMERMGLFKILGAILDDYATGGKYPVLTDSLDGLALEAMTRQVKMGTSSGVRDRDSSYRRCLGWTSDSGRKLGSSAMVNADFNTHFHKFIQLALEYYKDLRLAETIRGDLATSRTSVATRTSIKDTLVLLKQSLDPFLYGRNDVNTLSGIVWVVATLGLLKKLVPHLGIPTNFTELDKFVPAAYELLVLNRSPTSAESKRYTAHRDAARYGRRVLLDIEAIKVEDTSELQTWLTVAEDSIEGYRTAYRTLTGIDLGASGTPAVEQAV